MNFRDLRILSLKLFIAFLALTAIVAIISVLSGEFGRIQWKILATCFTISAASICSMSCAAFIEKKRQTELGIAGALLSALSAILVITGIWPEIDSEEYWKTTATFVVITTALAHAFLLLLPRLQPGHRWLQWTSSACIGILALQIIIAMWGEVEEEAYYRILSVVAIVVGLQTLVIPIMMKLAKGPGERKRTIVLEWLEGDVYQDASGNRFRLKETDSKSPRSPDR